LLSQLQTATLCSYRSLENGIHEFVFKAPSPQAVDQWFDYLAGIYDGLRYEAVVPLLLDIRQSGLLPMAYTVQTARRWLAGRNRPSITKIAFVHEPDFPSTMIETFFRLARLEMDYEMRFFLPGQREAAVAWLAATV
jgi:hypothetical protein